MHIFYDGQAVQEGTMDVRDLAPALYSIGELCQRANKIANGEESEVSVRVKAEFQPGSFGIDLEVVQSFLAQATNLFLTSDRNAAKDIVGILFGSGGLFALYKFLKGQKEGSITTLENGNLKIDFEGNNNSIEVHNHVHQLYNDD